MKGEAAPLLVATFGNALAGDDALGPLVAREILARPLDGVAVVELDIRPVGLLNHLAGRSTLYVVDAVWDEGEAPGRLVDVDWFDPERPLLDVENTGGSTHTLSVAHVIALAEGLRLLPRTVRILGLTARRPEVGRPLTPAVRRGVPELVRRIAWRAGRTRA